MQTKQINDTGARGYLKWLKISQPRIYRGILPKLQGPKLQATSISGLGDTTADPTATASTAPAPQSWIDNIKQLVTGAAQIYLTKEQLDQQKKITDMQLSRAQQGLPPLNINPAQYGLTPTVSVGMTEETKNMLLIGGLGLGAFLLLPHLLSGSRRRR